jgi:hypothetical protein
MPIDFPNNPSSGQTYSYSGQQWSYDGVAWNKIITATIPIGGICGSIQYNDGASGLSGNSNFYYDGTNVVLIDPIHLDGDILGGVHHYAHNNSGVGITRGWPVYITGMDGASTIIRIATADASDSSKMPAVGLAESDIADGAFGHITMFGTMLQTDTSGYATNQTLYVAPGGGLTSGRPSASNQLIQNIGKVGRVHPNTGSLIVMGPGRSNDVPNIVPVRSWLEMPSGQTATSIVTLFNGLSGSVTGVQSIDGVTGAITNVARTNVGNTFTVSQKISGAFTSLRIENTVLGTTADYSSSAINFYSGTTSTGQTILPVATTPISTITLPNFTTTLAGLTGTQTFTGTNTFSALTNFSSGISAAGATFSSLVRFNSGISAAGGITFNSDVTVNLSNNLNVGGIQSNRAALEIDTARVSSRVVMGDYTGLGNATSIYLRNATSELNLSNPFGVINIGDLDGWNSGYVISYDASNGTLYGNSSVISDFNTISCYNGFYETTSSIRVTNNARSWFL